jgi:hypothetical protein
MQEYYTLIKDWFLSMGENHGVDPLLLGIMYVCSKVFLFSFLGWVVKNLRTRKPVVLPLLLASVSFSVPYTYLIVAGRNIPLWVYVFIILMFSYAAWSIWKKIAMRRLPALEPVQATGKDFSKGKHRD